MPTTATNSKRSLKFWNFVDTSQDDAELYVYGDIINGDKWVYDFFEEEATDQFQFIRDLNALGKKKNITVYINSPGGDMYAGHTINNVLKRNGAYITVCIDGIAASAASIIAMAADKLIMPVNSTLMIHDPLVGLQGYYNSEDLAAVKDILDQAKQSIIAAYTMKSNLSEKEIAKLMKQERYLTAKEAHEMGFADEVLYDRKVEIENAGKYVIVNSLAIDTSKMKDNPFISKGVSNTMPGQNQDPNKQQQPTPAPQASAVPTSAAAPQAAAPTIDLAAKERERMKAIDAIAANIDPELVNEAKYGENPMTAEQLAFRAMQEGKLINSGMFEAAVTANKAAGTDNVQAQGLGQNSEKEFDVNNLNDVNAIFSAIAANSQAHRPQNIRRG
ncbi:head maturation protease, ClpP-related [Paenibacillus azoreducens]|uniref:head maturation protease, ClpP-related n=1 Tax=Paenibacillus azoreducens TaxID=116718 RepID=UPI0039F58A7D